jgi:hypothetical protein
MRASGLIDDALLAKAIQVASDQARTFHESRDACLVKQGMILALSWCRRLDASSLPDHIVRALKEVEHRVDPAGFLSPGLVVALPAQFPTQPIMGDPITHSGEGIGK